MEEGKSKLTAFLLGILWGGLGIHNFYLKYTKKAIIQLSISLSAGIIGAIIFIISWLLFFFSFIGFILLPLGILICFIPGGIQIWGMVEAIMIITGKIKTDANGIPLKD